MSDEPNDNIDSFLTFLEELYPGATSVPTYVGASAADIEALLRYAAGPIPPLYRQYLEVFGGGDGLVKLCDDAACDVASILAHHASHAGDEDPYIPPNATLISIHALSFSRCLLHEGTETRVAINEWDQVDTVLASSFKNFLYSHTWRLRWLTGASVAFCPIDKLGALTEAMLGLDVEKLWFSDEYCTYAEGRAIWARVFAQGNEACLSLGASTKKLDEQIFHDHFRKAVPELKR
ncbi:MAG: hypothetical protein ACOY0T_12025 [Myxococcota bacterium]